jgi:hypothetical protein
VFSDNEHLKILNKEETQDITALKVGGYNLPKLVKKRSFGEI